MALEIWNNQMHTMELRLEVAVAEIERLRTELEAVKKERERQATKRRALNDPDAGFEESIVSFFGLDKSYGEE